MKNETVAHPFLDRVVSVFDDWLTHRREMREMRQLDSAAFEGIAHDLLMTPDQLDTFARQGPHAADELPKLLKALGIDAAAMSRSQPAVLHDMERVCVLCERKAQCSNDVELGVAARDYEDYCLNAPTIKALNQSQTSR